MFFRRCDDPQLALASYLIGCQATGTAIVVDPSRIIAPYLEIAAAEGLSIVAISETHIHADFVSGSRELAAATGARVYLSDCGPPEWQYRFRGDEGVSGLLDRSKIEIGNVIVEAVHTPGHTPEHLAFLVTDGASATEPMGILSGDFVFVNDVGRPDLLERAARIANTAEQSARQLFRSLGWFKSLPDHLQIWPAHGAGSACGKGLGAVPQSTVGYERRYNWALGINDEDEFVRQVLAGQPEPPRYFGRMKQINRDGPRVLGTLPKLEPFSLVDFERALSRGEVVVDGRSVAAFGASHLPGSINVPLGKSFTTYGGSVLPFDQPIHLILPELDDAQSSHVVEWLVAIGFDSLGGVAGPDVVSQAAASGHPVGSIRQKTPTEVNGEANQQTLIVDVRSQSEWAAGHIAGARLIPLPELLDRLDEIPVDADVVVHCQGGTRSAIAASVLKARGHEHVSNMVGGYTAWSYDVGSELKAPAG
jgi:hydroxyacylglutathione hydrolase